MESQIAEYISSRRFKESSKDVYSLWLLRLNKFCNKTIGEVTVDDLNRFYKTYQEKYTDKTLQLAFNVFHAYFKFWALEVKCLNYERINIPRARSNSHHSITEEEHQKMMAVLPDNDIRNVQKKLICSMLFDTGMRVGELTSMKLQHIHERHAEIETEKTTKKRTVFWGNETERLLHKYVLTRKEIGRGDNLFIGFYGQGRYSNKISTRSVERIIKRITKEARIKTEIVPHSYRHSRIRRWFNSGLSPHQIILLSGHESIISLEHYMRLGITGIKDLADKYM